MSATYDHGPLRTYQVIWKSGHVEQIQAHQVLVPLGSSFFTAPSDRNRLLMHGEVEGRWMLILDADYDEVASVRLVVNDEALS